MADGTVTETSALDKIVLDLDHSLAAEDWFAAKRHRNALKRVVLRSAVSSTMDQVEAAQGLLHRARALFVAKKRLVPRVDGHDAASRMSADLETFEIALEIAPAPAIVEPAPANATEAIVTLLTRSNMAMSNRALAQRLGYQDETVARALGELRRDGRVLSYRVGRKMMNAVPQTTRANRLPAAEFMATNALSVARHEIQQLVDGLSGPVKQIDLEQDETRLAKVGRDVTVEISDIVMRDYPAEMINADFPAARAA